MNPLLTLDCGNSTLDAVLHRSDEPMRRTFRHGETRALADWIERANPGHAIGVTVRAGGLDAAEAAVARLGVPLRIAGRDLPCPLATRYPEPATLGADRWVAALAAHRAHGAAIVVDCGTALTVDAVSAEGVFLGGCIAPGLGTVAFGLAERAPALPRARLDRAPALPAVTSGDAVDAGVTLGFCGAVERLVGDLRAATGLADAVGLVTGGDADVVVRHARVVLESVPDLVHRGLRCLAEHDSRC